MKSIFVLLFCVITCIYAEEVDFLDNSGEWAVYVDTDEELTIYSWGGKPLAYLDDNFDIYGFNGRYLGWFENGIMYDTDGYPFACVEEAYIVGLPHLSHLKLLKSSNRLKVLKK